MSLPRSVMNGLRALIAFVVFSAGFVLIAGGPQAEAAGTPDISLVKTMPTEALAGDPAIPVTLSATNPTGTDGFNLTFTDVLPPGVTLVTSTPAPTQILANTPGPGETTLVWRNVSDLQAGVTESVSYTITHDGSLDVGDSFTNRAGAFVNSDPRIVPTYNLATNSVDDATGFDMNVSVTTDLVPFLLIKTEPNTESELLRGLHDQQTVYTFEIQNNYLNNSTDFAIEDWIPAGMEFLGCGLDDYSTTVGNDLPGPINPGNAPAMSNPCVDPDTVEMIVTDPPGPAPSGTYTRVVWSATTLATTLAPGAVARFDYVAAIPMRENTTTWDSAGGVAPATNGPQGSNIDNNNGPFTQETLSEQAMTNYAELTGTYTGDGLTYSDDDEFTVSAEDLSIHKSVDNGSITQGADSTWTLLMETSEYVGAATSIVVTDTIPDGLCPLGAGSPDVECQAAGSPSQPYTSATENSDGTWTLVWNVADMGPNEAVTITFPTRTRTNYQEGFADADPVLANDAWVNTVALTGTVDGRDVVDESSASQQATGVTILKEVATRPTDGVCGDGSALTWNSPPGEPTYNVGDRVCWRLTVDYPTNLDTFDTDIQDYLPPGHEFTGADGWQLGAGTSAPAPTVTFDGSQAASGLLNWVVGDGGGFVDESVTVEIVLSSTITDPTATSSGSIVENLMKLSYVNTAGTPFNLRSLANIEVIEPEIDLVKGVYEVSRGGSVVVGPNANPNVDGVLVMPGDVVTYQLTVTNSGDLGADNIEVWDNLPAEWATCSTTVTNITNGGVCDDGNNRIRWDGTAVFTVAAGGTQVLRYDVTVPSGIAPRETMVNNAGVRSYTGDINIAPTTFTYVPANNIDPAAPTSNTATADDPSNVLTGAPTIGKTAVTAITEAGNAGPDEATIGEEITYTATVVIPQGTTMYGPTFFRDRLAPELELLSASFTFDGSPAPIINVNTATDVVRVTFADPYDNPVGSDDTLVVTIVARVIDIPANSLGESVRNRASLRWTNQDGVSQAPIVARVRTDLVEPDISIAKSNDDTDGIVVGTDVVNYTLDITNGSGVDVSVAHDVVVVDTLPEGVALTLPVPGGGVWVPDGTPGNGVLGTITWTITSIDPATTVSRTYSVTIDDPVVVSTSFTNNAAVAVTSMVGSATGERTSGTGYSDTASDTLNAPLVSIAKAVTPSTATIGDVVTYTVDVTVPANAIVYDATVLDTLAPGLSFYGITGSSCLSSGGGLCTPNITVTQIGTIGTQTAAFFLGDVDTPASNGEDRIVTITYEAHILDMGSAGDTLVNSANAYGNQTDQIPGTPTTPPVPGSFDVQATPATATVTIVEPTLTIDKDVVGQVGDSDTRRAVAGETLTYTLVVSNTGTSDANNITVTDTPDDRLIAVSILDGVGYVVDDADPSDGTLQWTIVGPVAAGDTVTITYDVQVPATFDSDDENPLGPELTNIADIPSYYGVPEAERAANPTFTYRNYDDVDDDQVDIELDLASIGDRVWFDVNNDGVQDVGEPGLAGVDITVTYYGTDGAPGGGDDEVFATTTGINGIWLVEDLPGGTYSVTVDTTDLPAGMTASYDLDGGTASPDDQWVGFLGEDEDKRDVDFGYTGTGSIGDTTWFDRNGDEIFDPDEYGLEGVAATVTWLGLDGVAGGGDDIAYPATTDANGNYLVPNLLAGNYTVVVDPLSLPTGMQPTFDADGLGTPNSTALTLGAGVNDLDQDFGYNGPGSIGDFIWFDTNGDGVQDTGEAGIPGATVQLTWPGEDGVLGGGDDEVFLTTTDASGAYLFDGLPLGEYQVDVIGGLPMAAENTYDEDGNLDSSVVVILGFAENRLTTDFGYRGTASIGDTIWWDMNGDGVLDVGEPGIPGVEVTLTYGGVDGIIGTSDDLTFTAITDPNGNYIFTDLPEGNYEVTVTNGVPAGMSATFDEDGGGDETSLVTGLTAGEVHLTADFGYNGMGSIGDFVWLDLSADGVQDGGEPGIGGVDITLTWYGVDGAPGGGDDVVLAMTTDVDGNYLFPDLPAGGYEVALDPASLPAGLTQTFDADGVGTPDVSTLVLAAGDDNLDQDFGYNGSGSVGDTIWFDRNGDGVLNADEYGIGGVDVDVIWAGPDGTLGNTDDEVFPTTTDVDGNYLVTNLPPGNYTVVVDASPFPVGVTPTFDEDGTLDNETQFPLADGETHLTADFGYQGSSSIGDFLWLDVNGDGVQDPGEPGIPGQGVELTWAGPDGIAGNADDQVYTTTTDASGGYLFDNLPAGEYEVVVTGPITTSAVNTFDVDGDLDSAVTVNLTDGEDYLTADFGYQGTAEIGDTVWLDLNGDGNQDPLEPGIGGVEVTVTWYGPDGVLGAGDDVVFPPQTTDATGMYLVTGLPDGNFGVAVSGGIPPGLVNTFDEDGDLDGQTDVTGLTAGDSHLTADFGYAGTGSIGDTIWWDLDADTAQQPGEPGLAGADVTLTWAGFDGIFGSGDDAVFTATTDADGNYLFSDLPPGDYQVVVDETDLPPGLIQTADPDGGADGQSALTLGIGEANLAQDFGYRGIGSIGDFVWYDLDNNGAQDPDEPGLGGVDVTATYLGPDGAPGGGDDVVFTATTNAEGNYTVPGLPAGNYEVAMDTSTLPAGLAPAWDVDGGDPAVSVVGLGLGEDRTDVDFGVIGDASLSGTVWNDRNGDGVIDPGEAGIPGVTVIVTWDSPSGPVVIPVVSGPDGTWDLPTLPPGNYTVVLDDTTAPPGMSPTTPTSAAVTLPVGGHEVVDIGLAEVVSLGSVVWVDTDGDGVPDAGEDRIQGVRVNLFDDEGNLVVSAITGPNGTYLFTDLVPGTYTVRLDATTVPEDLRATFDRDGSPDLETVVTLVSGASILDANFGFQVGLPVTGVNTDTIAWLALLMVLLGAALVWMTRRRMSIE